MKQTCLMKDSYAKIVDTKYLLKTQNGKLTPNERVFIGHRFGKKGEIVRSLSEVAFLMGVTRQRAYSLQRSIMRKLNVRIIVNFTL